MIPGTAFGKFAVDNVRFNFATSRDNISKAIEKLDKILSSLPNIPLKDVPIGRDENDNKEILKVVEIKNNISKDINLYCILLPEKFKDISEYYESGEQDINNISAEDFTYNFSRCSYSVSIFFELIYQIHR